MDQQQIRSSFTGRVIFPADSDYDSSREVFYGGIDSKPAVIVRVANVQDIKQAIELAKAEGMELSVRSGGHSVAGYSASDGGLVVDMRDMRKINISTVDKTAWVETGLQAVDVTRELDKHDLVLGFGDTGSVGIGGITLGGGIGFLVRKFGMAIDNLLAAEIVTADGEVVQVDEKHHADLFWAIRGGGGNFGIVSKFKYRLHELSDCYGGMLFLPATPDVITGCMRLCTEAPDELSMIINVMPAFPMPFIPKEYHGKLATMIMAVYAGDPLDGEKALAPFKALAKPYVDMTKKMRYKDIFPPEDGSYHPTAVSTNLHLTSFGDSEAQLAMDWLNKLDAPMKALQLRVLGGAMARVPETATAYAHRKQPIMANIAAFYEDETSKRERQQWVHDFRDALLQGDTSAYVGFMGPNDYNRVLDAYPKATLERLKTVKRQYDPENFFRHNFNIE